MSLITNLILIFNHPLFPFSFGGMLDLIAGRRTIHALVRELVA